MTKSVYVVKCSVIVKAESEKDAKNKVDQMMIDYFKHYCEDTEIQDVNIHEAEITQ